MITIKTLGALEVIRDGRSVELPASRKTRALLAYLAVTAREHRRERLCEIFWEVPDDPRGSLRWSLTKLRRLVDAPAARRINATRETVRFEPNGASVDVLELRNALREEAGDLRATELEKLAALFRGEFLEGIDLPNCPGFQSWLIAERESVRALRRRVLAALTAACGADTEAALRHARMLVDIDPRDEAAQVLLIRLLARAGRGRDARAQYEIAKSLLDRPGNAVSELALALRDLDSPPERTPGTAATAAASTGSRVTRQEIRFCTARDGVRVAYARVGAGPPLVKAANWLSHLEYDWESPIWRHLIAFLAERHTLVRYDERGNGLSDRDAPEISFDAFVTDLEAVIDASGIDRFALFGLSQGCAVAIAYAVRHPQRVTHLVLHGGYARGWKHRGDRDLVIAREAMLTLVRMGWGKPNPAFRQVYTSLFFPDGTPEQFEWFNELQRVCTTPDNAVRLLRAMGDINVSEMLSQVRAPTLVTHCAGDAVVPFEEGRNLATGIPGARFMPLDSANHTMLEHESAWQRFTTEVRAFLGSEQ